MAQVIPAIRGMNDILPSETYLWQQVENIFRRVLRSYGYREIRTPIIEKTELFKRSIGEVTDIVEKEMYTFLDRNEESLTLRPEGTACCVRAGIEHGLLYNQIQRLWYQGPYFRYERPQKGRYRQFYQCTAEIFGLAGPDIDAELIATSFTIIEKLGILEHTSLELNSLGSNESRASYRKALVEYFNDHKNQLDDENKARLHKNPLRILDSKDENIKKLLIHAPKLTQFLDPESQDHFERLQSYLIELGIPFTLNPRLVRGLDYYNKTVFEWVTNQLGAQNSICGGGRYDSLVEQLGGKPTKALGFSFGMERVILLLQQNLDKKYIESPLHVYIMTDESVSYAAGLKLAQYLRNKIHGIKIIQHAGGGSLKNQFKKADKSGALFALILGEHEVKTHSITLKFLREDIPQQSLYQDELAEYLKLKISKK